MANVLCKKHDTECFCGTPVDPNHNTVCPSCRAKLYWHSDMQYCLYCQQGSPEVERPEVLVAGNSDGETNPLVSGIINLFKEYLPLKSKFELPERDLSHLKFYCYLGEHPLWDALFKVAARLDDNHADLKSALLRVVFEMAIDQAKMPVVPGMYNGRLAIFKLTEEQAKETMKDLAAEHLLSALKEMLNNDNQG